MVKMHVNESNKNERESKMNESLKQNYESLLYWAKFACEELNAQYSRYSDSDDPADHPPTWLAELSSACDSCEINGGEAIDHENG
jgi:hypothetical protein